MNGPQKRNRLSGRRLPGHARRGAATVEFAFTAPLLMGLLLGMVDVGQMANVGQAVSGASACAAREAAKPTSDDAEAIKAQVTSYLADRFPNLSDTELASTLRVDLLDSAGNSLSGASLGGVPVGSPVVLQVAFQFDAVRWLGGVGFGQGRILETSTVVRRE